MSYPPEAIAKAKGLYAQGCPHEHIEREMRKEWPTWTRKNLYGEDGWIERYGFDDARAEFQKQIQAHEQLAQQTSQDMLVELTALRKKLFEGMKGTEENEVPDPQKVYAYNQLTRTITQLLKIDDSSQAEAFDLDSNTLWQILMEIPEIEDVLKKKKKEIRKAIEAA